MKKIFILLLATCYLLLAAKTFAVSPAVSPTPQQTPSEKSELMNQQINDLKTKIASKVAQLKLVERRGIIGTVTEVSSTQIALTDLQNNIRFVDVDELTKFSSPSAKGTFGISDITKGSSVGILGLYNKESRRILARFVNTGMYPKIIHGVVISINSSDYVLKVISEDEKITFVDVETITKTLSFTKQDGLTKYGFSKIKEGQNLMIAGFTDIKNNNHLIASRIIIFPQIPKNPKIKIPENVLNAGEETKSSTGSGKKLTPITK